MAHAALVGDLRDAKEQCLRKPGTDSSRRESRGVTEAFPQETIEAALQIPQTLKAANGGNPWPPTEVAKYLQFSAKSDKPYGLTAASETMA